MPTLFSRELLGESLEKAFFSQMDPDLVSEFKRKLSLNEKMEAFQNATGIRDRRKLELLIDAGFEVSTLTAFTWLPLVFVAWADGQIDVLERDTIFDTLISRGIAPEAVAMMTEHAWFHTRPTSQLWGLWRDFSVEILNNQSIAMRNELMDELVTLCHVVANASGEGSGSELVTDQEWKVIDRVAEALCPAVASN